ncbi:MAG: hypothetical protein QOJ00_807 [Actinomycetota bacterium]
MSLWRRNKPAQIRWGTEANQLLDVYTPDAKPRGVVALIHGGFWRAIYGREGLAEHCTMFASDGYVAANVAYRRVGEAGGGWPGTCTDVVGALQALTDAHGPLTAVIGHSAGGHLALWASKEVTPRPKVVISVAGCNDLGRAQHINAGNGAVDDFLGGPGRLAELAAADPVRRVPLGVKTLLVVPDDDGVVSQSLSDSYLKTALAAGDDVELTRVVGDHFSVLDVGSAVWTAVRAAVDAAA